MPRAPRLVDKVGGGSSDEKYAVPDETAMEDASEEVKSQIPDFMNRVWREHKDPVFKDRLKARIRGA